MSLPPDLDQKILNRFDELIAEASELISRMVEHDEEYSRSNPRSFGGDYGHKSEFRAVIVKVVNLVEILLDESEQKREITERIKGLVHSHFSKPEVLRDVLGTLQGLKDIYENGFLDTMEASIYASITSDYMNQVEAMLDPKDIDKFQLALAAAGCGMVLESALRRLCELQSPPVATLKSSGKKKLLNALIQDLQKANAFNKLKGDQLRAYAKTRNYADHADHNEFTRNDVDDMVRGVRNFLADYL